MSSSRRRLASRLSVLALAASILFCRVPVRAAQHFEQSGRLCASAVEMSALSGALAAAGYLDMPAGAAVTVHQDADRLRIQNAALGIDLSSAFALEPKSEACVISSNAQRLATTGSILVGYVASFAQVVRYRAANPPAAGGADIVDAGTSTIMAGFGPYVLVMFWTPTASPPATLSCLGLEYYRVDPRTNAVLPFDGCVEGHNRVLPGLNQLPSR
jgi:hypothetical protein